MDTILHNSLQNSMHTIEALYCSEHTLYFEGTNSSPSPAKPFTGAVRVWLDMAVPRSVICLPHAIMPLFLASIHNTATETSCAEILAVFEQGFLTCGSFIASYT